MLVKKIISVVFYLWMIGVSSVSYAFSFSIVAGTSQSQSQSLQELNFWHELRASFMLNHEASKSDVREQIQWLLHHQYYLNNRLQKAVPYLYFIFQEVKQRKLPGELVLLPLMESAYNPFIYSKRGAAGLWQLMPSTANEYGIKEDWWYDGRRDIFASTKAALSYLRDLNMAFNGEWLLAIAAYDSGASTIQQAIKNNASWGKKNRFWSLTLPHETRVYVPRLLALATIVENPDRYGFKLPIIQNQPYFDIVNLNSQIELAHAAKLAGASLKEIYQLNPGFNHFTTDPKGPHRLLIPIDKVAIFKQNLAKTSMNVSSDKPVSYTVQKNDTLAQIANKFNVSIQSLKEINYIKRKNTLHPLVHPGQILLIPNRKSTANSTPTNTTFRKTDLKKIIYRAHAKDNLHTISKKFGVMEIQIEAWNKLNDGSKITKGRHIIIWLPATNKISLDEETLSGIYYVKAGDSLSTIAHKFHTSISKLRATNKVHKVLQINQRLIIPT